MGMVEIDKNKIAEIMEKHSIIVGYVFGSVARGTLRPHSDIDVAVLFPYDMPKEKQGMSREEIRDEIASVFGVEKVDVINLNQQTNPVLRYDAVLEGKAVLVKDVAVKAQLTRAVLREYENTRHLRETSYKILRRQIRSGQFGRAAINSQKYVSFK
ncbi:MAG: polymerase beta domain protein region protein [Parcubacteria group bacterium GW2011_GWA2_47_21]|nr:MAG: polymerase beta domain protein region protein [Parcubacteria group bacterium GW2011_GWA2_47_21]